jgi:hypothetical protein
MNLFLIAIALFVVGLSIMIVAVTLGGRWLTRRAVEQRHRALEQIIEEGKVPARWKEPFAPKLVATLDPEERARIQAQAKQRYLEKLDDLIHYVQGTELVANEATREYMLTELKRVRERWVQAKEIA